MPEHEIERTIAADIEVERTHLGGVPATPSTRAHAPFTREYTEWLESQFAEAGRPEELRLLYAMQHDGERTAFEPAAQVPVEWGVRTKDGVFVRSSKTEAEETQTWRALNEPLVAVLRGANYDRMAQALALLAEKLPDLESIVSELRNTDWSGREHVIEEVIAAIETATRATQEGT